MVWKLGRRTLTACSYFVAVALLSWTVVNVLSLAPPVPVPPSARRSDQSMSTHKIWDNPPFLAILTEPDACASTKRVDQTINTIERATVDGDVSLVVVRVVDHDNDDGEGESNKWILLKRLSELKQKRVTEGVRGFLLVVNNDVEVALKAISCNIAVDGVHVKEHNARLIPDIRQKLHAAMGEVSYKNGSKQQKEIIIGSSCHSIKSALDSYKLNPRGVDYLFVGTCYFSLSHPEKTSLDQLEGPTLPGRIKEELYRKFNHDNIYGDDDSFVNEPPVVFAIGGIDEKNCKEPVKHGADGVAAIRTVMQADDAREIVKLMKTAMLH